ncbi:hypothetical protein AVEN_150053-1 [Araneus ventricosus]|uniref:Uncharacterized protein n=1 Tax=Araneus ventricosus TaxID=182803 RepID=A0A4Y2GV78_ARAVE|nr:hypothetical protein AVEN_150053-1 [Araneus ventricosus]
MAISPTTFPVSRSWKLYSTFISGNCSYDFPVSRSWKLYSPYINGYVPQHRTLKLQDTRQDKEQHLDTSTQTGMTERHHGKKMAPVAPPTIERRRQLIVTTTSPIC